MAFFLIILNVMMLMVYRRQKREFSHLYANPATGSNLVLVRSVVISIVNAAFNIWSIRLSVAYYLSPALARLVIPQTYLAWSSFHGWEGTHPPNPQIKAPSPQSGGFHRSVRRHRELKSQSVPEAKKPNPKLVHLCTCALTWGHTFPKSEHLHTWAHTFCLHCEMCSYDNHKRNATR